MFASFERKKILSIYFVNLLDVFMNKSMGWFFNSEI